MKSLCYVLMMGLIFLLTGCGITQEKIGDSPEEINQALREGKLIKSGDWIRATSLDEQIHEFSFISITGEELVGGDTTIPLDQIKQLEVFPLRRSNERPYRLVSALDDTQFESRLAEYIENESMIWISFYIDGNRVTMHQPKLTNSMLEGNVVEEIEDYESEYLYMRQVLRKFPVTSATELKAFVCKRVLFEKQCILEKSFYRWSDDGEYRREAIEDRLLLKEGDWLSATLHNGQIREFQYQGFENDRLIGGDGSIAASDIQSMEIYPVMTIAPSKSQSAGGLVGAVFLTGMLLIFTGGMAAAMVPAP